jgi:poly(A) polymerase
MVKMWEQFDEAKMGIVVRNIRRCGSSRLRGGLCRRLTGAVSVRPSPTTFLTPANVKLRSRSRDPNPRRCDAYGHVKSTQTKSRLSKNENPSPDPPSKRRRPVKSFSTILYTNTDATLLCRSSNTTDPVAALSSQPKFALNVTPTNPLVEPPSPSDGIYTSTVSDPMDLKTPQPPLGEDLSIATGQAVA